MASADHDRVVVLRHGPGILSVVSGVSRSGPPITRLPIGTPFHPRTAALCESMSWRDWAGYFAVSQLRGPPRARVQRDPQRGGADRRLAALQVPGDRPGRDAARRPHGHAGRAARWRSARSSTRTGATGEGKVIDDGTVSRLDENVYRWTAAEPEPALDPHEQPRPRRDGRGRLRQAGARSRCRARPAARSSRRAPRATSRASSTSASRRARIARHPGRDLAHRLHRRPRLRDLGALGQRRARSGTR